MPRWAGVASHGTWADTGTCQRLAPVGTSIHPLPPSAPARHLDAQLGCNRAFASSRIIAPAGSLLRGSGHTNVCTVGSRHELDGTDRSLPRGVGNAVHLRDFGEGSKTLAQGPRGA